MMSRCDFNGQLEGMFIVPLKAFGTFSPPVIVISLILLEERRLAY